MLRDNTNKNTNINVSEKPVKGSMAIGDSHRSKIASYYFQIKRDDRFYRLLRLRYAHVWCHVISKWQKN